MVQNVHKSILEFNMTSSNLNYFFTAMACSQSWLGKAS